MVGHAFACPVTQVSSRVWRTLSCACILYKWLCFCVLYCTVLYGVQYLYFELDLQEGDFIELLAVQHEELTNEDLMEMEPQRKYEERQEEEVTEELMELEAQRKDKERHEEEVAKKTDSRHRKWQGDFLCLRRHC